jgi:hypothetical protein
VGITTLSSLINWLVVLGLVVSGLVVLGDEIGLIVLVVVVVLESIIVAFVSIVDI